MPATKTAALTPATYRMKRRQLGPKSSKPQLDTGLVFRARGGANAGKVLIVVASDAEWTSGSMERDFGSNVPSGWWIRNTVRLATDDEIAAAGIV